MTEATPDKLLNACPACGRQYDVSHLRAAARVRCECGRTFPVERHASHTPRALKCSNCGGVLQDGARTCGYCAAEITLAELRLSCVCPQCYARLASDARFCMECGIAISPQALFALAEDVACPRCKGRLQSRELGRTAITECSQCAGIWLTQEAFLRLCERTEADSIAAGQLTTPALPKGGASVRQGYIPCLACRDLMQRKNYASASGVIIDVCREHGVWLDAFELEKILEFIRAGGLDRARRREIERLEDAERRLRSQSRTALPVEAERNPWSIDARGARMGRGAFAATLGLLFDSLF